MKGFLAACQITLLGQAGLGNGQHLGMEPAYGFVGGNRDFGEEGEDRLENPRDYPVSIKKITAGILKVLPGYSSIFENRWVTW